ncbi:nitrous oxide reductase accessory protein NosL [Paenibacillus sp. IB182496]|uniref:Nitrous oxide reductase accessory protein NosL n=1 Tax=Paenibacillus sabuli TaxID=2772509 RepID=A0A927GU23_9BACL|nr:nitrous oxide reductase accessory protein NosL [Paenibacillus sabuli]MBD2847695.1 nitrous oxide reductase accessory protein NosL [Paenibacillus sabuli]
MKNTKNRVKWMSGFGALLLTMVILSACGTAEAYSPEPINEETDRCVICNMAIKDDQYATQIITKDGQSLKFDDLGDMNVWKTENGTATIGAAFVRDYETLQWLDYEKAYYVYDAEIRTPMAFGIVSFESEEKAEAFIAEQGKGKLMTAEELADHSWEVNRDMMDMDGMDMDGMDMDGMEMDGNGEHEEGANMHGEEESEGTGSTDMHMDGADDASTHDHGEEADNADMHSHEAGNAEDDADHAA